MNYSQSPNTPFALLTHRENITVGYLFDSVLKKPIYEIHVNDLSVSFKKEFDIINL